MFRRSLRRMRRPMMRAPIVSFKHQQQADLTYGGMVGNQEYDLYNGMAPGGVVGVSSVPAGNKVYSVNVTVNFIHTSGTGSTNVRWMLVHLRSGQDIPTCFAPTDAPNWSNIGLSSCRNQVIKSFLSLAGTEDAGPQRWNLHIKIPKMWHRVREGDRLLIVFSATDTGDLTLGSRFKSFS